MSEPKCPVGEANRDIVSIDILDGVGGYCCCIIPIDEKPGERVKLCWFKENYRDMEEYLSVLEAAKVGGALTYAAALVCIKTEGKEERE